jgi:hypothetical protein
MEPRSAIATNKDMTAAVLRMEPYLARATRIMIDHIS